VKEKNVTLLISKKKILKREQEAAAGA